MNVKTCSATIKAAGPNEGTEEGVFEAIVAAYNVDSVGDQIMPGAFKKSLDEWKASGDPIPVLWSHKSDDPDYHIGHVLEAEERPEGLWVKAQIDIDDPRSKSAKVYRLLKGRRVRQFSFAYDEIDARPAEKSDSGAVKELHELKVYEVGPCLIGCNQETNLLAVKQPPADAAPAQVCENCGESGHLTCFDDAKNVPATTSDIAAALKESGTLSKEHIEALTSLLADLSAKAGLLGDLLDVLAGPEVKATPAQPADDPAAKATVVEPARPGTASVLTTDVLSRLALMELDADADTY